MTEETPDASIAHPDPVIVHLDQVAKRYGAVDALKQLDLTVRQGEVYGFLGRNGAGKSTALRIIMGITLPSSGTVELFGHRARASQPELRREIGYVAQEQNFYGWMTALGIGRFVAGFYPDWRDAEFERLLRLLDIPPDRKLQTFSAGMHAKLALALALAHNPRLLVLDEPTAGMDAVTRREFIEIVREQAERSNRTTLFSSHLIDEVELAANTVGIVDGGEMIYEGPLIELQESVRRLRLVDPASDHALPAPLASPSPSGADVNANGFTVLQDLTARGERNVFVKANGDADFVSLVTPGWRLEQPSLEDIFIAMVTRPVAL